MAQLKPLRFMIKLYKHQVKALELTKDRNKVAYYLDMGLGKTFVGSEKMAQLGAKVNLVICQKSKVNDWVEHFKKYYENDRPYVLVEDLTKWKVRHMAAKFLKLVKDAETHSFPNVYIINYDLAWRRPELLKLKDFTLMLDESSEIQNASANKTRFILKLNPANVILLSGTPCSGKYENLWTQAHLLGWEISSKLFDRQYVNRICEEFATKTVKVVNKENPYKNSDRLKRKLRQYGAVFMQSDEVFDLPDKQMIDINIKPTAMYREFKRHHIVALKDGRELVGDTPTKQRLYFKYLAGAYNQSKLDALVDLIHSTRDRLIIFYNYNVELDAIRQIIEKEKRPLSLCNGSVKDLTNYEQFEDSITLIQYQSGSKGLNLQKANKIIYFSPTDSCENYMQSMKRVHRIGQERSCFYYRLICGIERDIYQALESGRDYTLDLFQMKRKGE